MSDAAVARQTQIAHPLDEFYARARQPMPAIEFIDGEEAPAPYKQLLVHESDMTSTLEHFYEQRIHLRVLKQYHLESGGLTPLSISPRNSGRTPKARRDSERCQATALQMAYMREVVLELEDYKTPVEFGAIKIYLGAFPPDARERIIEAHWPLGRILKESKIPYISRPKAFLRVGSDRLISEALQLKGTHRLYGRCNRLSDPQGNPLADIVEILPPSNE